MLNKKQYQIRQHNKTQEKQDYKNTTLTSMMQDTQSARRSGRNKFLNQTDASFHQASNLSNGESGLPIDFGSIQKKSLLNSLHKTGLSHIQTECAEHQNVQDRQENQKRLAIFNVKLQAKEKQMNEELMKMP